MERLYVKALFSKGKKAVTDSSNFVNPHFQSLRKHFAVVIYDLALVDTCAVVSGLANRVVKVLGSDPRGYCWVSA
jgi:hypothetical protein